MINSYYTDELITVISAGRLKPYGNDNINIILQKYIYNLKLSEALYPALSLLEITLRNRICNAVEKLICKDWLIQELSKKNILNDKEYHKLLEAANKLEKTGKKFLTTD